MQLFPTGRIKADTWFSLETFPPQLLFLLWSGSSWTVTNCVHCVLSVNLKVTSRLICLSHSPLIPCCSLLLALHTVINQTSHCLTDKVKRPHLSFQAPPLLHVIIASFIDMDPDAVWPTQKEILTLIKVLGLCCCSHYRCMCAHLFWLRPSGLGRLILGRSALY